MSCLGCASSQRAVDPTPAPNPTALATASASATTTTRREPPADPLDGRAGDRTALRAWITRSTELVFGEMDEPFAKNQQLALAHPIEAIVVDQVGQRMRVVIEGKDLRLVVLVPPSSTAIVPKRSVWLAWNETDPPSESDGIRIGPGVVLEELASTRTRMRAQGMADGVRFEGWIDADALDRAFVHGPFAQGKPDGLAREGAEVLEPGGKIITRLPRYGDGAPALEIPVETVPGAPSGLVRIVFRAPTIELRGLVRAADWRALGPDEGVSTHGSGWGDGGGMSDTPTALIEPGAMLFDRDDAPVGKIKRESTVYFIDRPVKDDPTPFRVWIHATGLGFVTVYVHPQDLRPR